MRRMLAALAATVVVLASSAGPAQPAGAVPAPPDPPASGEAAPNPQHRVTLVTGDVVHVHLRPDGRVSAGVERDTGPSSAFRVFERDGHTHVVPVAAQPYLDAGLLDPRLFDVTLLLEQGYDDATTPHLPLLLQYGSGARAPAAVPIAGQAAGPVLPSIHARPFAADKGQARHFWRDVTGAGPAAAGRATAGDPVGFDRGLERIWLDARVSTLVDRSVPHIGAPVAHALGYDGSGVTVAVLDTGVDADHPAFAGRIAGTRSFTPDGTVADGHGHGTHVASIVAGVEPGHTGVAPGTDLLVGKVLGEQGFGQESWIIAGMEWAVSAGADVVNLSLGSYPTDGSDPMSAAVDALSDASDTLFVIAAGNSGPSARSVSAPAAAASALAVGNATLDDTLNPSSSRGPRLGDNAIKPEITAPGTGIVAARAGGGHQAMSGTSMAAPHVAGAAAILRQQHPDWTAEQVRAGLVSTSVPLSGASVWEQGAGRLAVDRAVTQTVRVDRGVLNLGYLHRDTPGDELVRTRTLTYRNDGPDEVTLEFTVDLVDDEGVPAPEGTVTVSPATLTLAPGASAGLTVRLDATGVPAGQYAGRLVATGGPHPVTTAVGFYRQGDQVDVSISLTDRHGDPAGGYVTLLNYDKGVFEPGGIVEGAIAPGQARSFRIPRATYSITAQIATPDASGRFLSELSLVFRPQAALDRNAELTLDARRATPVEVRTPREATPEAQVLAWSRGPDSGGNPYLDSLVVLPEAGELERVSVAPTEPVTDGTFDLYTTHHLAPPWLTVQVADAELHPTYLVGAPRYDGRRRLPVVDVGTRPDGADLAGAVAVLTEDPAVPLAEQVRQAAAAGAVVALITPAQPGLLRGAGFGVPIPAATLSYADGQQLRRHLPASVTLTGVADPPYTYDLVFHDDGWVPESMARTVTTSDLARLQARYHGDGSTRTALLSRYNTAPCPCGLSRTLELRQVPYQRTEYVTAGDAVWSTAVQGGVVGNLRVWDASYDRGVDTVTWGQAPLAPTAAALAGNPSTRDGDVLRLRVTAIADAYGHSGGSAGPSSGVLYRDGTVVAELFSGFGDVPAPADEATYRLEVASSNGTPEQGRLSTHTETAWTFRSRHVDGVELLPLLSPRYELPVSIDNAVNPRAPVLLRLAGAYQDGTAAPLQQVEVAVSFDDGGSWRAVPVRQLGGERALALLPVAGAGQDGDYVSLRVRMADPAGRTVTQTVVRAFRLATHPAAVAGAPPG